MAHRQGSFPASRREFITLLGGAAAAWPLAARAQQRAMPVIAFFNSASSDGYAPMLAAFRQGLKEAGYLEGQNVTVENHFANGQYDRLPAMAAELARRQVAGIVANTPANLAAKMATTTIPIVFTTAGDPLQIGLVTSLSRPSANLTGVTQLGTEVALKRLELAHELVPMTATIAVLINPTNNALAEALEKDLQGAAKTLGRQIVVLYARNEREIDAAFSRMAQLRTGALVIGSDALFTNQIEQLAALALSHAVPAIYQYRAFAAAGGLASYGAVITDSYRLAGVYAGRILKGEKPSDLPVQQSTKVELIINMKTAKALGLTFPTALLVRADEVIE